MQPIDINPPDLDLVREILRRHVPDYDVWAFGSRVKGNAKKFSDLDLAIISDAPIKASLLTDLNEAFDESTLPFKVDVVDWASASEVFRRIIEQAYIRITLEN